MLPLLGLLGKVKTLLDRLTADRAAAIDTINTNAARLTSGRASNIDTAKTNTDTLLARLTSGRASNLDNLDAPISSISGGYLKTVAAGVFSMTGTTIQQDITIPSVDTAKAHAIVTTDTFVFSDASAGYIYGVRGRIINATTLRLNRASHAGSRTSNGTYVVLEWKTS